MSININEYTDYIEIDPEFALAYANRGEAYFSKKEYDKALNDVNKAQDIDDRIQPEFLKMLFEASG